MIGKTVSHFKILGHIGKGGMGVVYRALDTRLGREVALKFLPQDRVSDPDARKRMIREARAASSLRHKNICPIYEVVETEENVFIAMALIEGGSLRDRIKQGPLSLESAIDIGIQVAEGLHVAHEAGIVHRDVKPGNILLEKESGDGRDGSRMHPVIVDFGLALSADESRMSGKGEAVGTVAYMSPEQTLARKLDRRTDIWSLGVTLYEMLDGQVPFPADSWAAVFDQIRNRPPLPLTARRSDIPRQLEEIVGRCLAKNIEERFQTGLEVAAALRSLKRTLSESTIRVQAAQATPESRSMPRNSWSMYPDIPKWPWSVIVIAVVVLGALGMAVPWFLDNWTPVSAQDPQRNMIVVLPFQNLGPPEDEYFADGITEEITTRLAAIHDLGVIARTSAMQYADGEKSVAEVGEELGVDYILEGTIRWQHPAGENRVRVTPQLIRVSDATHMWGETYHEEMQEVFEVQSSIAENVARALDLNLLEPERQSLRARPTESVEAHEVYLRGKDHFHKRASESESRAAAALFEEAVSLDPEFAQAWASLARTRAWLKWIGHEDELPAAEEAAERARALAPDAPETHMAFGDFYYYGSRDYERALEKYRAVRDARPSHAEALASLGYILRRLGDWDAAVASLQDALKLNPRDIALVQPIGRSLVRMRRYPEAEEYLNRLLALSPGHPVAYVEKTLLYLSWDGDRERAARVLDEGLRASDCAGFLHNTPASVARVLPETFAAVWDDATIASDGIDSPSDSAMFYLLMAEVHGGVGDSAAARSHFAAARAILEPQLSASVVPGYMHSYMGLALAGLQDRELAVRESRKAVEMLPVEKDALSGPYQLERLAEVYVRVGESAQAVDELERLLGIPSRVSPALLRLDPIWEPLRGDEQFQAWTQPGA